MKWNDNIENSPNLHWHKYLSAIPLTGSADVKKGQNENERPERPKVKVSHTEIARPQASSGGGKSKTQK
jgi:hypothetical protein